MPVGGGAAREIARLDAAYFLNIHLSPDGRSVAWVARPEQLDLMETIAVQGGSARRVLRGDDPLTYLSNLAWSPDGRTIYYSRQTNTRSITLIDRFE